ncbi:hypothetical protein [Paracraurococcus ruber]|uniref:DUF2169 domain-containing protein n=1 Tax=Paracraurococcus ruber TaxID=77675 RepID=A0ABS1D3Z0_9PROT|nr:hypothetical protein [Paracraurococcus ruber]MBK1660982.1 hypothetical protein [Paracraurococcus ruber]
MTPVRLPPVDPDADPPKRLNLVPHRHLGQAEFGIRDRYLGQRLDALAAGAPEGVVAGLDLSPAAFDATGGGAAPDRLLLRPGIAVLGGRRVLRLSAPLSLGLADLVPRVAGAPAIEDGVYLLVLRLAEAETVWGPADRPDAREEGDPLRDERRDSLVEARLSPRLALLPGGGSGLPRDEPVAPPPGDLPPDQPPPPRFDGVAADRFANLRAAALVGGNGMAADGAVPLALVAVQAGAIRWLNQAAGRWEAAADAGARLLAAQVHDALARAVAADPQMPEARQKALRLRLPRLPAAGQLPALLLQDPAGVRPACPLFPPSLDVGMAPLPAGAVPAVLRQGLRRAPLDLSGDTADAVTLLPVVADRDWRPDLADRPRPDLRLLEQLFAAFHQARRDWRDRALAHAAVFNGVAPMQDGLRHRVGIGRGGRRVLRRGRRRSRCCGWPSCGIPPSWTPRRPS